MSLTDPEWDDAFLLPPEDCTRGPHWKGLTVRFCPECNIVIDMGESARIAAAVTSERAACILVAESVPHDWDGARTMQDLIVSRLTARRLLDRNAPPAGGEK